MGRTIAQKIIESHLVSGKMEVGEDIGLAIDQTLTQDATGTMAYLEFEAMGVPRVKTQRSVAYVDHNTLQSGFENADDHRYIQTVANKHGVYFSRPGNGICHQLHLERFGAPGKTLIGSDSHTPTGGGIGMLAFGAGGMDVAVAMGGGEYHINMPSMTRVELTGRLSPWVSAKDVILAVLQRMSVKGGVGKRASKPSLCPSGPPSPTWGPSWGPPPPSSPRMRSPGSFCRPRAGETSGRSCPQTRTRPMTRP